MKVALVHDWLTGIRGGEKVLEVLCEIFPDADLYTMIYKKGSVSPIIANRKITTSFIDKMPFVHKLYQWYTPLAPFAVESFDLSAYDLVISSSHQAVKGVLTGPDTMHISYIHTPVRYFWDQYNDTFRYMPFFLKPGISFGATFFRSWDSVNSNRIDYLIANSGFVARRIKKYYNRESSIIYPPVAIEEFEQIYQTSEDYYVILSALVSYKHIDIAIKAFNTNGKQLKIIGKGAELKRLQSLAKHNIEFLGRVPDEELASIYSHAKGFIINSTEDFGITPVEAQAAGLPVIAFGKGGVLETVIDGRTGIFYYEQKPESLQEAIDRFETIQWNKEEIKNNAKRFSKDRFIAQITDVINEHILQVNTPYMITIPKQIQK